MSKKLNAVEVLDMLQNRDLIEKVFIGYTLDLKKNGVITRNFDEILNQELLESLNIKGLIIQIRLFSNHLTWEEAKTLERIRVNGYKWRLPTSKEMITIKSSCGNLIDEFWCYDDYTDIPTYISRFPGGENVAIFDYSNGMKCYVALVRD